jgi:hypothetical protein
MRERIHTLLRWLETTLVGGGRTFPIHHAAGGVPEAERLGLKGAVAGGFLADFPPAALFERDRFRVTAFLAAAEDTDEEDLAPELYLLCASHDPATGRWEPLLMLHESRLEETLSVLHQARDLLLEKACQVI